MTLQRTVRIVALANLSYFGVEFAVALAIGSVALFADSVDFLEDAAISLLLLVAVGWTARRRAAVGFGTAGVLLVPGIATLWALWQKLHHPGVPDPVRLTITGAGALAVNFGCAVLLARVRGHAGSLTRAAFLSARNDAVANVAIIAAGLITAVTRAAWPDVVVGVGIAALNVDAAREVYGAARRERTAATVLRRSER